MAVVAVERWCEEDKKAWRMIRGDLARVIGGMAC